MSGNIQQVSTSEQLYSYMPPIPRAMLSSRLNMAQFVVLALPTALGFEQSFRRGESRLYASNRPFLVKIGANAAFSIACSLVGEGLRSLQISSVTNGYLSESQNSYYEYVPLMEETDKTIGLGVDGARELASNPIDLQVEKYFLESKVGTLKQVWKSTSTDQQPEVIKLQANVLSTRAVAAATEQLSTISGDVHKKGQEYIDFVSDLKAGKLLKTVSGKDLAEGAVPGFSSSEVHKQVKQSLLGAKHTEDNFNEYLAGLKTVGDQAEAAAHLSHARAIRTAGHAHAAEAAVKQAKIRLTNGGGAKAAEITNVKNEIKAMDAKIHQACVSPGTQSWFTLQTAFKTIEWGLNFLRLGSFLHEQARYNERLDDLSKAYESQSKEA